MVPRRHRMVKPDAARLVSQGFQFPKTLPDGIRLVKNLNPAIRQVRETEGLPVTLGRLGSLEVRLALTTQDIRRAQRLRFKVFYKELNAVPDARGLISRRDIDPYDRICDHLLVIDHEASSGPFGRRRPKVVGTYRLLRSDVAAAHDADFYTAGEFNLEPLLARHSNARMLELGRSCVLKPWRTKRTVELLWQGIWAYVRHHRVDLMFGCASFEGTDPRQLSLPLSFLERHAAGEPETRVKAHAWHRVPLDDGSLAAIDLKAAMKALPPLIKGYLRLGATFGDGAVIDRQFSTTDVFVMLEVSKIDPRYIEYYSSEARDARA